jgi:hypothetical protein
VSTQVGVRVIVFIVAEKRGLMGNAKEGWIAAVTENLEEVGVRPVVDYIRMVLGANQCLIDGGHRRLHDGTVKALMEEACEVIFGLEED